MTSLDEKYAVDPHNLAAGWVGWQAMTKEARWSACLAALSAGWPLDVETMAWQPSTRLVAVSRRSRWSPERLESSHAVVAPLEDARQRALMLFGNGAVDKVERLVAGRTGWWRKTGLPVLIMVGVWVTIFGIAEGMAWLGK